MKISRSGVREHPPDVMITLVILTPHRLASTTRCYYFLPATNAPTTLYVFICRPPGTASRASRQSVAFTVLAKRTQIKEFETNENWHYYLHEHLDGLSAFVSFIPMPFRNGAKISITNDSETPIPHIFYDVNVTLGDRHGPEVMYFHACWRRERPTKLGDDFAILPQVQGGGRFLGCHVGVIANRENIGWWGEGEVKIYLDEPTNGLPSLQAVEQRTAGLD